MNRLQWAPAAGTPGAFLPPVRLSGVSHPMVSLGTARYTLGQTAQEWYNRAKAAIAQFDLLIKKIDTIDNKTERDNIIAWIGKQTDESRALYRYNAVKQDMTYDVAQEGVGAYNETRRQHRVEKLEEFNKTLTDMVETALKIHGVRLPGETKIVTQIVESYQTPILIGAGVIAAGILVAALL